MQTNKNEISNGVKKQIIIVVLILLVIAIVGVGVYYFSNKTENQSKNQQSIQPEQNSEDVSSQVKDKKLNCQDISDAIEKDKCLTDVAKLLNSSNSSVCESLAAEADKNTCRQSFIVKDAVSSGDLTKCNEAVDKSLTADCSAQASFSLAIQKKDKNYCENIINKIDKESCFKVLSDMGVK
jgi:flagellar basal body-associated protein FliL